LGAYAIGVSVLASFLAVQESLILLPYSIQRHRPLGMPAEHAGASLTLSGLLSALSVIGLIVAGLGLWARGEAPETMAMVWALRRGQWRATMRQSWDLGKWLFVGQMTVQVQRYVTYWLSMLIAGAAVTGVYAACMSIVAFANPLIFGVGNILMPRSVLAWKSG